MADETQVPVTEARARLAELVNRVAYGGERIELTRHGKIVAALISADDLARLEDDDRGRLGDDDRRAATGFTAPHRIAGLDAGQIAATHERGQSPTM